MRQATIHLETPTRKRQSSAIPETGHADGRAAPRNAAARPRLVHTAGILAQLGAILLKRKKYADAETLLLQGYEGVKQRQDELPALYRHLRLREALERLVQFYEATDQKDKAAHWRQQLQEAQTSARRTKL